MGDLFYVYEHWRPDRDECFYVGKGRGRRANDMRRSRNRFHKFIQDKLSRMDMCVEVRLVADGLQEHEAFALEVKRIAFWRSSGADLANMTDGGEGPSGRKHTEEWKRENGDRARGRTQSPEARAKISASAIGNTRSLGTKKSAEAIEKTASFHRGKTRSEETCRKISEAKRANPTLKGRKIPAHIVEKIRIANTGKLRTEETRAKMRKPKGEEHKRKLSEANIGKTHNEETRKLLSEKAKADWARRKTLSSQVKEK
jgi:hypothetical protein